MRLHRKSLVFGTLLVTTLVGLFIAGIAFRPHLALEVYTIDGRVAALVPVERGEHFAVRFTQSIYLVPQAEVWQVGEIGGEMLFKGDVFGSRKALDYYDGSVNDRLYTNYDEVIVAEPNGTLLRDDLIFFGTPKANYHLETPQGSLYISGLVGPAGQFRIRLATVPRFKVFNAPLERPLLSGLTSGELERKFAQVLERRVIAQ